MVDLVREFLGPFLGRKLLAFLLGLACAHFALTSTDGWAMAWAAGTGASVAAIVGLALHARTLPVQRRALLPYRGTLMMLRYTPRQCTADAWEILCPSDRVPLRSPAQARDRHGHSLPVAPQEVYVCPKCAKVTLPALDHETATIRPFLESHMLEGWDPASGTEPGPTPAKAAPP